MTAPALDRLRAYFGKRDPTAVEGARQRYAILEQSLAKLNRAGARIILGADTGLEDHLFGMAEQLELEAMVDAGMTPAQAIVAATSRSAEYLGLKNKGALRPGFDADFIVLDANPLDAITNTRRIARVVLQRYRNRSRRTAFENPIDPITRRKMAACHCRLTRTSVRSV